MKKLFFLFLATLLLFSSASADPIDLSGLSFDELVALRDQINLAIWNCQEWQEVTVPAGVWIVGQDIPAGHWSIEPMDNRFNYVTYCEKLDETGKKFSRSGKHETCLIISKTHEQHNDGLNAADFDMVDGWYFYNDAAVTFTPYAGKPELSFK